MEQSKAETTPIALETIISNAVKIPGVKVNRSKFLAEVFANEGVNLQTIIDIGPVSAGISQERIEKVATKLIFLRTSQSSAASFVAGIPGGFAMAATIPADVAQFFGMALRLAQELSYLYGASDLWDGEQLDDERVQAVLDGLNPIGILTKIMVNTGLYLRKVIMKKQRLGIRPATKSVWMRFVPMVNLTIVFSAKIFGLHRHYPTPFPLLENVSLRMNMNLRQRHSHNKYLTIPTIRIGAYGSLLHKHILICIPVLKTIRTCL